MFLITCAAWSTMSDSHPGCTCDEVKWTGPHCEVKIAPVPTPAPSPAPSAVAASSTSAVSRDSGKQNGKRAFGIAVLVVIVCVLLSCVVLTIFRRCCMGPMEYSRENVDPYARRLRESAQEGYRDEPVDHINLAPRRSSTVTNNEEFMHLASSSRDPFASHLANAPPQNRAFGGGNQLDGPQVYLGPPKDEDGNVLHSVEIL